MDPVFGSIFPKLNFCWNGTTPTAWSCFPRSNSPQKEKKHVGLTSGICHDLKV